jgi:peroxiredoxin
MKRVSLLLIFGLLVLVGSYSAVRAGSSVVGKPAPVFSLVDTNGKTHSLSDFKGKYVVLEWVNYDCPFVKKHYSSGNMQKLQKEITSKGVIWLTVSTSAPGKQGHYPADKVNALLKEKNSSPTAYLLDSDGKVGRLYGARTTPHMYIINPEGVLIYNGAIDDKPSTNPADIDSAKNFVRSALDEAMAGKAVTVSATQPYGCSVKY